jgi:DNA-binding NarL/FixJ family response regulator
MALSEQSKSAARKTRVLLVDDHPMVRERLAEAIQREPDLTVCGEAESRPQAMEIIAATRPHLAIIDLTLKNSHGLELIKDIHAAHPEVAMLVVSMHDELLHAERVIRAGARGYITKQEATRKIMLAIRTVLKGGVYLSDKAAAHIAASKIGESRLTGGLTVDKLSDRELRIFELTGEGKGTRQISEELELDVRTIHTYRARIKNKFHLKDFDELRQFAVHWSQTQEHP